MLDFTKLILNSIQIEDVAEVQDDFRKKRFFLCDSFFFCSTEWVDGLVLKKIITKLFLEVKLGFSSDF